MGSAKWKPVSDWMSGDRAMIRKMIEESAAKYATEKGITAGCMKRLKIRSERGRTTRVTKSANPHPSSLVPRPL